MNNPIVIVRDAIRASLSDEVKVMHTNPDNLTVKVMSRTPAGTPVYRLFKLTLEPCDDQSIITTPSVASTPTEADT